MEFKINTELVKTQKALKDLSAEQVTAIVSLVQNIENEVAGDVTTRLYGQFDNDLKALTGQGKPKDIKTHEWMKQAFKAAQAKAAATGDVAAITKERDSLKAQIDALGGKGGAAELASKLATITAELETKKKLVEKLEGKISTITTDAEKKYSDLEHQMQTSLYKNELSMAMSEFEFDDKVKPGLLQLAKENATSQMLNAFERVKQEDGTTVFKKDGIIQRVESEGNRNATEKDLLSGMLVDVLKATKPGGGGTGKPTTGGDSGKLTTFDFSGATSKVDANSKIRQQIASQGTARGTKEFEELNRQVIADNQEAYDALPDSF